LVGLCPFFFFSFRSSLLLLPLFSSPLCFCSFSPLPSTLTLGAQHVMDNMNAKATNGVAFSLVQVRSAASQVVAGTNYRFVLDVNVRDAASGAQLRTEQHQVRMFRALSGKYIVQDDAVTA